MDKVVHGAKSSSSRRTSGCRSCVLVERCVSSRSLGVELMVAMRIPWNPKLVPTVTVGIDSLPATPTCFIQAFPSSHLHKVSPPLLDQ
jgi:hypothetical protein